MQNKPSNIEAIDSLRGIAALMVFAYHFSVVTNPLPAVPEWLLPLTLTASSGVTLFFIISSFTLCLSMGVRRSGENLATTSYYIRRYFRVAPLFYFWILIILAIDWIGYNKTHSAGDIAKSASFMLNFYPGDVAGFVPNSWTLGVEFIFYLIFPLVIKVARNLLLISAILIASIIISCLWHAILLNGMPDLKLAEEFYWMSFIHNLPSFIIGVFIYNIYQRGYFAVLEKHRVGHLLVILWALVYFSSAYGLVSIGSIDKVFAGAILHGLLVLGLLINMNRLMVNKATGFMGIMSYSLYLLHVPVIKLISPYLESIYSILDSPTSGYFFAGFTTLMFCTAFSSLTYKYIEKPGICFGARLINVLKKRFCSDDAGTSNPLALSKRS